MAVHHGAHRSRTLGAEPLQTTSWYTPDRALVQPHDGRPGSSALGPLTRPGHDVVVLLLVMAGLIGLVWWRSGVEYPVPVSIGNMTIQNAAEVLADAEGQLQSMVESQGGRIAEGAACYFWRPLGPTQGGVGTDALGELLTGLADEGTQFMDVLLCGPAEVTATGLSLPSQEPWVPGVVSYFPGDSPGTFRGEVSTLLPAPLPVLTATGGVDPSTLLTADGRSPDGSDVDDPTWREVTP